MDFRITEQLVPRCTVLLLALGVAFAASTSAQTISLAAPTGLDLQAHSYDSKGNALPPGPANFRRVGEVRRGELGDLHTVALRFSATVKLTGIESPREFRVEQGGSCVEGNVYEAKSLCTLLVRFTPQGAGRRLGRITIHHTGPEAVFPLDLGGWSPAPVISFIPAQITTLAGTYPASVGLLNGAQNLGIDGSDTLYIADSGNKLVRRVDSSGSLKTIASNLAAAPVGVAADATGTVWFSETSADAIFRINTVGTVVKANGSGSDNCGQGDSCSMLNEIVRSPRSLSIAGGDTLYFAEQTKGAASSRLNNGPSLVRLYDPFPYSSAPPGSFAVDPYGNRIYSSWMGTGWCQINGNMVTDSPNYFFYTKIAGGTTCGFSGDGAKAGNAQISNSLGQFAFDQAGNLYFSDTGNQRVRRVDASSNIIRTIAGSGSSGYSGDGGSALNALLSAPGGLAVDSQGAVYIISGDGHGGMKQVIRKVGPQGYLGFSSQTKGTASAAKQLVVSNTGTINQDAQEPMVLTKAVITGANAADFKIDLNSTSCDLTGGAQLPAGQSCKVGIIFTPSAGGARTGTLVLLDNTINGADSAVLTGQGILPAATLKITSPTASQSFKTGTAVTFKVSVTASSAGPTGTVQFKVDGANYGSAVAVSAGAASTSVTGLTVASHTLSASYSGDSNYAPGGPVSVTIAVAGALAGSIVSLSPAAHGSAACAGKEFTVGVWSESGSFATGIVELVEGGRRLAAGPLSRGRTILRTPLLSTGTHRIVARYKGDASHRPGTSPSLVDVVRPWTPCVMPVPASVRP